MSGSYQYRVPKKRSPVPSSAGDRLRAFREKHRISLREAARQLHVSHPVLRGWEDGTKTPSRLNRDAIQVWTRGDICSGDWPLPPSERHIADNAGKVKPFVAKPAA